MDRERWMKIEELFNAAVELPEAERLSLLNERCNGDDDLRISVEELLAGSAAAPEMFESPVWSESGRIDTTAKRVILDSIEDDEPDRNIGQIIGAYRLTKAIGKGGMGAVYLAERADGEFDQRVAIKLIKRGMDSDFVVRRFRRERRILAAFDHPNIARLLDGGTTETGHPYFVMEYIEGLTLFDYCDSKEMGLAERLELFQKICSALEYAHEMQIVHRDIKPGNILINRTETPKLLDFGIAKILDPDLIHESVNPTASMLRMMTPDYASPEQIQGVDVTARSDIYSLGVLLYEFISGYRPYNFRGRALHEVSKVVCEIMPAPPSTIIGNADHLLPRYQGDLNRSLVARSTTAVNLVSNIAGDLDNIVMRSLAKRPSDRYASVQELSADADRYLRGQKVYAPSYVVRKPIRRDNGTFRITNKPAIAVLPFKYIDLDSSAITDDRFLGLGLADALITRLSRVRRLVVRPTSSVIALGDRGEDPIWAGEELNTNYILAGNIKKAGTRLRVTVQLLDVAKNAAIWAASIDETLKDVLTLEDTLANKVVDVLLPQLSGDDLANFEKRGTDVPEAFEHYLRGRYHFNSSTEEGFAKAFVSFHSAIAADPNYALAYAGIADYYNWLGIIGVLPPDQCFQPAIQAASKAVELDGDLSEARASLGFALHLGNFDSHEAEKEFLKAIEIDPSNSNAYVWYSIVLFTLGRFDEGFKYARLGAELAPLTPFNHHNIGWGLYFARRYVEAEAQYRRVVSDFPDYAFGYYGLSKIHRITGSTKAALEENAKAYQLMNGGIFAMLSEAECLAADGQTHLAVEKLDQMKELGEDRYVSPYLMALPYCFMKEFDPAIELLEQAAEAKDAWLNWLAVDPVFDPIRNESAFAKILKATRTESPTHRNVSPTGSFAEDGYANFQSMHELTTLVSEASRDTDSNDAPIVPGSETLGFRYVIATIFLAMVLGMIVYFAEPWRAFDRGTSGSQSTYRNPTLLVLPFTSENPADRDLGVGLADALTSKLGNIKSIQVLSSGTGRAAANADLATIGSDLGVSFVVRGTLAEQEGRSVLQAEFVDVAYGEVIWSEAFTSYDGDLFGLQTRLAERVWTSMGIEPLPLEKQQIEKSYTQNIEAYELYLIGRYQLTRRSPSELRNAISTFGAALAKDANFAPAYVGLADAYALIQLYDTEPPSNSYDRARENAFRAIAIDENLAEAHATLAYIRFYADRDRDGAELGFRRAIQINPSLVQAHHWFALFLAAIGRHPEALQEIENARRLDPRSLSVLAAAGMVRFYAGEFDEALVECDRALSIDKTFVPALKVKRWIHSAKKNEAAAKAAFFEEIEASGGDQEHPGWKIIAAQVGELGNDRADSVRRLDEALSSPVVAGNPYAYAFEAALAYVVLGDNEKALVQLERAEGAGSHGFNFMEVEPRIASLSKDPRFRRLLEQLRTVK
jgi:serine/threonine protein kinase/tetratricopeptide (TPR) repeat protein